MFEREKQLVAPYKNIDWDRLQAPAGPSSHSLLHSFRDRNWRAYGRGGHRLEGLEPEAVKRLEPLLSRLGIWIEFDPDYGPIHMPDALSEGSKVELADLFFDGPPAYTAYAEKDEYLKLRNIYFKY